MTFGQLKIVSADTHWGQHLAVLAVIEAKTPSHQRRLLSICSSGSRWLPVKGSL